MRRLPAFLTVVAAAAVLWSAWPPSAATRAGWMEDYEQLRAHTARAYANLGDRLVSRKISPRALEEATRAALGNARGAREARRALQSFVGAFDDGHFRLEAPPGLPRRLLRRLAAADRRRQGPVPASLPGGEACSRMGFRDRGPGRIAWDGLAAFRTLGEPSATRPFPAGFLSAPSSGPPVAVLEIGLFSGDGYPALCAAEWERYRRTLPRDCDHDCQSRFRLEVDFALADRLAEQLGEIERAGARTLLVDITGNGGGSSVVDPLARTLSPVPLRLGAYGFIRHPHWVRHFTEDGAAFDADLAKAGLSDAQRAILTSAREEADSLRREAEKPCDLSALWRRDSPLLPCPVVGRAEPYLPYAPPGSLDGLESKGHLFNPAQYRYREGAWRGRLWVLMDRRTASASEQFAALLRDNGAATLLGAKTAEVGCGYTNGGVTLELRHTGLTLRAPDCIRYRKDGTNEAEGVSPDIAVPWARDDDGRARAEKVLAALPRSR